MADALAATTEIGVIGAGAMGAGIAQVAAQAGHRVQLFDTRLGAAEQAKAGIAETLAALAAKGKFAPETAAAAAARIVPVHALGAFVFGALGLWIGVASALPDWAAYAMPALAAALVWTIFNRVQRGVREVH